MNLILALAKKIGNQVSVNHFIHDVCLERLCNYLAL
jgi:hypothetical protein